MNRHKQTVLRTLEAAVLLFFCTAFLVRCASMMTPVGGPKDTIPPVVVAVTPADYTTDFTDRKIFIEFDEYVQLKDQQKEFFTSPQMKRKPSLAVRGKGIQITIRDTLKENTTYALNFGSAVRDNNEGNPLNSLRYVFSTGPEIDSLVVSGYTADSYKADSVGKSFVWFFRADSVEWTPDYDSTVFNYKPDVIARAENNGIFIAQNLKPVPYRVYAVQDKNDNQLYDPGEDQIGFLEGTYNPAELPDFALWYDSIRQYVTAEPQLYLRMFTDKAFRRQILQKSERPLQHKALLYFGAPWPRIDSLLFDSIPADRVIVEPLTAGRDTLALWFDMPPEQLPDTIRGSITYYKHDSINRLQPATDQLKLTWRYIESKQEEKEREKQEKERERALAAGEEWQEPEKPNPFVYKMPASGEINPEQHLTLELDYPLVKLDSAAVLLTVEREGGAAEEVDVHLVRDTFSLRRYQVRAPWTLGGKYKLTIPEGALVNPFVYKMPASGEINPEQHLTLELDYPLVKLDSAAVLLTVEREGGAAEEVDVHLVRDTFSLRRYQVRAPWTLGGKYKLTIPEGALVNVAGEKNDSIVGTYTVYDPEKFARVTLQVAARDDSVRYIVQLLDANGALKQEKLGVTAGTYTFNYVPAGEIRFRVIEDRNANGKWDTGNLVERRQPERAEMYVDENGNDTFVAKVNWDIEMPMDMDALFAPVTMQSLIELLDQREQQRLRREAEKQAKERKPGANGQPAAGGTQGGFGMGGAFNTSTMGRL